MKSINILVAITVLLSFTACSVQIKNATTESVKINGNCAMCKSTIEKAGNVKQVAMVDWNKDTKMATLIYDTTRTNQNEILKRIALAGYDSEQFLAPDDAYSKLPDCCQYDRAHNSEMVMKESMKDHSMHSEDATMDMPKETIQETMQKTKQEPKPEPKKEVNQLTPVFNNYFALKDALVKTDSKLAADKAKQLHSALKAVQMNTLSDKVHIVWMKVMDDLMRDAEKIQGSKDVESQRNNFMALSDNMYQLMKASNHESPVYYQHCPMANGGKGANWLSKENAIKNPYYGSVMLTCGRTVETLK
jgi:copper chaperone CopZ